MPMVGDGELAGDPLGECSGHPLQDEAVGPGLLQGLGIIEQSLGRVGGAALDAVATQLVHRLGGQADVAHHRDAGLGHAPDRLGHGLAAFQLDRLDVALLEQAGAAAQGLFGVGLVAAEGQIPHQVRALAAARDGAAVVDDVVEGDGDGVFVALNHHAQAVPHQHGVDLGGFDEAGEGGVVAGDHDDALVGSALLLADGVGADARHRSGPFVPGAAHRLRAKALRSQAKGGSTVG
jgi:hypothetical protein